MIFSFEEKLVKPSLKMLSLFPFPLDYLFVTVGITYLIYRYNLILSWY